jgi:hypothetical protein
MTIFENWAQALSFSLTDILTRLIAFVPNLVGALLVVVIGWIVASLLEWAIENVLRAIGAQTLFQRVRVEEVLQRAEIKKDTSGLIGSFVKWIILLVSFTAAADILQLAQISEFLNQILSYVPNVVAAAAILLLGTIFAHFLARVVRSSIVAAQLSFGDAAAAITKYSILVFTIIAALVQLGIAEALLQTLFTGLVAMLAIAGGLAFGLGGQSAAKDVIETVRKEVDSDMSSRR